MEATTIEGDKLSTKAWHKIHFSISCQVTILRGLRLNTQSAADNYYIRRTFTWTAQPN